MPEPRTIDLTPEPATREAFAPYGVIPPFEGDGNPTADLVFTRDDGWVKVDFDLKSGTTAGKKGNKHYVWVKGETGSHIGGRWVEVEDGATEPGQSKMDKTQGQDIRTMQQNQAFHDASGVNGH